MSSDKRVGMSDERAKDLVTQIFEGPNPNFTKWLISQGLSHTDAEHDYSWHSLMMHLRKLRMWETAQTWMAMESKSLIQLWRVTGYRRIAKELVRRFVRARMQRSASTFLPPPIRADKSPELEILPDHILWVFQHPGLCLRDATDSVAKAVIRFYEENNPAPSQGAVNRYLFCLADKDGKKALFADVERILLEERRRRSTIGQSVTADDPETESILDLEAELELLKKAI